MSYPWHPFPSSTQILRLFRTRTPYNINVKLLKLSLFTDAWLLGKLRKLEKLLPLTRLLTRLHSFDTLKLAVTKKCEHKNYKRVGMC